MQIRINVAFLEILLNQAIFLHELYFEIEYLCPNFHLIQNRQKD